MVRRTGYAAYVYPPAALVTDHPLRCALSLEQHSAPLQPCFESEPRALNILTVNTEDRRTVNTGITLYELYELYEYAPCLEDCTITCTSRRKSSVFRLQRSSTSSIMASSPVFFSLKWFCRISMRAFTISSRFRSFSYLTGGGGEGGGRGGGERWMSVCVSIQCIQYMVAYTANTHARALFLPLQHTRR